MEDGNSEIASGNGRHATGSTTTLVAITGVPVISRRVASESLSGSISRASTHENAAPIKLFDDTHGRLHICSGGQERSPTWNVWWPATPVAHAAAGQPQRLITPDELTLQVAEKALCHRNRDGLWAWTETDHEIVAREGFGLGRM